MLSRFVYNDCFKKVPYTGSMYELDCKGNLRDTFRKKSVECFVDEGILKVSPVTGEWFDGFSMNLLLAIVHRNTLVPPRLLSKLEVIHKSGDPSKISLYDTVWKCPEGKLEHPLYPGFCYVPGFSRYLINQDGQLLSPASGDLLSPYEDASGYLMYGVQPDIGSRTVVGMHRLLCLAWKPYPASVDKLDVNHIDTIKSNNSPENLEWVTRSRNNYHAHENGLSNSKSLKVRDVVTGEITTYYSIRDAARNLGIDTNTLSLRVRQGVDGTVYEGHQYKLATDTSPWIVHENMDDYRNGIQAKRIRIVDVKTGIERTTKSIGAAADALDIKRSTLAYRLAKNSQIVVNGYTVSVMT